MLAAVGNSIGLTSGQTYTVVTGVVVAVVLAAVGLPPVLQGVPGRVLANVPTPMPAVVDVAATPPDTTGTVPPARELAIAPPPTPAVAMPTTTPDTPSPEPAPAPPTTMPPPPEPHTVGVFARIDESGTPGGIAVAPDGTVYVVSDDAGPGPSRIVTLNADGEVSDIWEVSGQPEGRRRGLTGVAVDGDTVVVADASRSTLLFVDRSSGEVEVGPRIPDVPACVLGLVPGACESGVLSSDPELTGVAVADDGVYYVSDRGQGLIWRVVGTSVRPFASFDDRLPGEGPAGVSVDRYGDLIVPMTGRLLTLPPGLSGVYVVRVTRGHASAPRLELELGDRQVPGDLVVGESGRAYLTLPDQDRVLDAGLDSGDRLTVAPGDPPFSGPSAITLADDALLVAGRGPSADSWVIHTVTVLDRPARPPR